MRPCRSMSRAAGYGVLIPPPPPPRSMPGNRKDSPRNPPPVDRQLPPGDPAPRWDSRPTPTRSRSSSTARAPTLVVAGATIADVVSRYNLFSGGGAAPPLWGLGFWHRVHAAADALVCGARWRSSSRHIPLDVIGLEPGWMTTSYPCTFEWQKRFPDPPAFVAELLSRGIRPHLWENLYVLPESRRYKTMFPLSASHMVWLGPSRTTRCRRPAARLSTSTRRSLHIVSGYKIDEVDGFDVWLWLDHASFPSGTPAPAMRQAYGLLMQDLVFKGLFKARNQRTYGLVRASNGAASGYPFAIYSDAYDLKDVHHRHVGVRFCRRIVDTRDPQCPRRA